MAYIYDIADVWAASGTVFTGIKLNVTNTASAAGSSLMDLQVGGTSRFRVDKNEGIYFRTATRSVNISDPYGLQVGAGENLFFCVSTGISASMSSGAWNVNVLTFGISTGSQTFLQQDGSTLHTIAQRNGVNAQAFNLYNTFTDASNYERGFMRYVSNVLQIGSEKLGTGTARALAFQTDGTARLTISASGTLFDTTATQFNFGSGTRLHAIGNGALGIATSGNAAGQLVFGAFATVTETRLKSSGTTIQARLGDDSAFTNIQGKLTTDTAYTAGTIVATGYLTLYDITGTAYRVPCVV